MEEKGKHITYLIENSLLNAINEVRGLQTGSNQNNEIHFKRMIYHKEYNLIVVEIDREQFPELPEKYFESHDIKHVLLTRSNCYGLDTMTLGRNIYIYFWLGPNEPEEPIERTDLAYAI